MKYSFRLTKAGPKTQVQAQWGLPLNLQICAKCGALNAKAATICSKCAQPLPATTMVTDTGVTPPKTAAAGDIKQEIPEHLKSAPSIAAPPHAAPATHIPVTMLASQDISREQNRLRLAWLVALILTISGAVALLVSSYFQSPPATHFEEKQSGNDAVHTLEVPPPVTPKPAATATQTETETPAKLPENRFAEAVPVLPERVEPLPKVPPAFEQSENPAPPRTARGLKKRPAQVPQESEPVPPTNTPCSDAAKALALCNLN
ncbi:MAG: hypothetical protein ABI656_00505 [bacterium]